MRDAERPILILYASAGAGHMTAAGALREAFVARVSRVPVEVHDVLASSNRFFRKLYAGGYLAMVKYIPLAMGVLYEVMDRPDRKLREGLRLGIQNLNCRPMMRWLVGRRPRLIVNTHYLGAEIVSQLRGRGRLDCPQVTVTTDLETHRLWVQPPTERYYTATELGKAYLTSWGVAPEQVLVTGIPVRAAFERPADRALVRRRCGVAGGGPVVLMLCGGFGVGPTEEALAELVALEADVQIVVITGRNPKLRARLQALSVRSARPVRVLGYTERMHEWMKAADLVVSKPGGLTVAETLVCGVPLVILDPIPGQESRNSDYLLERGAALKVNNVRLLRHRVSGVLRDRRRLGAMRRAVRALARPGAAAQIAADALGLLEGGF